MTFIVIYLFNFIKDVFFSTTYPQNYDEMKFVLAFLSYFQYYYSSFQFMRLNILSFYRDSDSINSSTISDKIVATQNAKTLPIDPTVATVAPASPVTPVSGSGASGSGNVSLKVPSIFRYKASKFIY